MTEIYSKAVATIEDSDSEDTPHGGFTAVLSTPSLDRDGDRLMQDEWVTPLPERLPLDVDHGMTVADTIGSFRPYFDEAGRLMMEATFASTPKAQEVRTLVKEGHIASVSVAFLNDKTKKDGEPRRELLNAGVVAIPSNRDAMILASKAAGALKDSRSMGADAKGVNDELASMLLNALEESEGEEKPADKGIFVNVIPKFDAEGFAKELANGFKAAGGDNALLQAIHDASVHLGAMCVQLEQEESGESGNSGKSVKAADADDDPKKLLAGIDAILDEAIKLTADVDRATLPQPVAQALDLLVGAEESVDELMDLLGVYDPDDENDDKGIKWPEGKRPQMTVVHQFHDYVGALNFGSQEEAKAFFTDMLKSIEDAEANGEELVEIGSIPDETTSLKAFEDQLDAITKTSSLEAGTPQESPAEESPAEAAAATDEVPAPAVEAAEPDAAESEGAVQRRARHLELLLFASES